MADCPRITDLSAIGPVNFKLRNTGFLDDTEIEYDGYGSYQATRRNIWSTRNHNLRRVLREFPLDEPLPDQCAHWMHAVVGRHFFPDANHRTAFFMLRRILSENGVEPGEWPTEKIEDVTRESHRVRGEMEQITMDIIYRKDELFEVWRRFFEDVLPEEDC
ncbi:hypothetical protein [Halopelagius fulvigenes]|uniref:Fido domain-containing protein n=1 Tax=Halopelagius fulvigenes TaxID=1198324 RepID=A0ABD5TUJ6_9EURY